MPTRLESVVGTSQPSADRTAHVPEKNILGPLGRNQEHHTGPIKNGKQAHAYFAF